MSRSRHLVHIGVHKTGSTWLQQDVFPLLDGFTYANRDPGLAQLLVELMTVDGPFARTPIETDERLLFSSEGLSGNLWDRGDSGTVIADRIATVLPGADVLVLTRNQPEMLASVYAQYVNQGGIASLADFLAGTAEGPTFDPIVLEYDRLVTTYYERFSPDRVWVVPYERMRADPTAFVASLAQRFGVPEPAVPDTRRNVSLSPLGLAALRTWNRLFRASPFNPSPRIRALPGGRRVRTLLQVRIDPILRIFAPPSVPEVARIAAERYAASNDRLAELTGESLRELGYP